MKNNQKYIITGAIVVIAALLLLIKYWEYVANPWTRDGKVNARVIQVTPRVSGPIIELPVKDNQFVKAGDLLFIIDPRTYEAAVEQARAQLDQTGVSVEALEKQVESSKAALDGSIANIQQSKSALKEAESQITTNKNEYERQMILLPKGSTSQKAVDQAKTAYEVSMEQKKAAEASLRQAQAAVRQSQASLDKARAQLGQLGQENAQIRTSLAALRQAELNLEFTEVRAPVDGYITNLQLRFGSNTVANQPAMALVDVNSYYIDGYFKETSIGDFEPGNKAVVTLMSYKHKPLKGYVESIGWGISQSDGSTGYNLLPTVSATFEWIRLAQRIPVRIHLTDVPDDVKLRVGTTCSVLVKTGTKEKE